MRLVAGSLLSFLQTSKPLSLGIMMSSRIRCGLKRGDLVERVLAVDGDGGLDVEAGQVGLEQLDVGLVVVGDQDATFFFGFGHVNSARHRLLPQRHRESLRGRNQCKLLRIILHILHSAL